MYIDKAEQVDMTFCETLKEDREILRRIGKEIWAENN